MNQQTKHQSRIILGDAMDVVSQLPENSVQTVVTSPPYWGQRDYGIDEQCGVEEDANEYIEWLVELFGEIGRVLREHGSLWLNIGDTYNGCSIVREVDTTHHPRKGDDEYERQLAHNRDDSGVMRRSSSQFGLRRQSRMNIPARISQRLCEKHNYRLRDEVIWAKKNPKPEGRVSTRLTQSHEKVYRFVQSESATFDDTHEVHTDVWEIETATGVEHPAPFPEELPRRAIQLTSTEGDTVLDPFCGSGTTLAVARDCDRECIGIDCNETFTEQVAERLGLPHEVGEDAT